MVEHGTEKPRRIFALEPLRAAHLEEIVNWIGTSGSKADRNQDEEALAKRMYTEFRRQYRPLWQSGEVDSFVMTVNRVAVFCVSLLRMGQPAGTVQGADSDAHIYLLCRPQVRTSDRLLLLAWQA